jgi:molecular chaperone DnaJ
MGAAVRVKIPSGSQSWPANAVAFEGHALCARGGVGDMFIELQVETPVNLTARQKEILKEFEALSTDNSPESQGFFKKVKRFWDGVKGQE